MDFVSFDLAKKLKDLGYNVPFFFFYRTDDQLIHHAMVGQPLVYGKYVDNEVVIAPTISQVLKWLREEHHLHFEVVSASYGYYLVISGTPDKGGDDIYYSRGPNNAGAWDNYEDCIIYGIEYVLDNLI